MTLPDIIEETDTYIKYKNLIDIRTGQPMILYKPEGYKDTVDTTEIRNQAAKDADFLIRNFGEKNGI
jgi:hypothetical protein